MAEVELLLELWCRTARRRIGCVSALGEHPSPHRAVAARHGPLSNMFPGAILEGQLVLCVSREDTSSPQTANSVLLKIEGSFDDHSFLDD